MKRLQTLFIIMLVIAFQSGCVHNYEPMINSILAEPNPAPANSIVSLTCKASDDDESSMLKKEVIAYESPCAQSPIRQMSLEHDPALVKQDICT